MFFSKLHNLKDVFHFQIKIRKRKYAEEMYESVGINALPKKKSLFSSKSDRKKTAAHSFWGKL